MKRISMIALIALLATVAKAQSAIAVFKPTYGGDEHYCFSTGRTLDEAKEKAMTGLVKVTPSGTAGKSFIYGFSEPKGWYAVGRGKDQYGHYWHYEVRMSADSENAAKQDVLNRLSARGLSGNEIVYSGHDE